jgi:hypothetical protein
LREKDRVRMGLGLGVRIGLGLGARIGLGLGVGTELDARVRFISSLSVSRP